MNVDAINVPAGWTLDLPCGAFVRQHGELEARVSVPTGDLLSDPCAPVWYWRTYEPLAPTGEHDLQADELVSLINAVAIAEEVLGVRPERADPHAERKVATPADWHLECMGGSVYAFVRQYGDAEAYVSARYDVVAVQAAPVWEWSVMRDGALVQYSSTNYTLADAVRAVEGLFERVRLEALKAAAAEMNAAPIPTDGRMVLDADGNARWLDEGGAP